MDNTQLEAAIEAAWNDRDNISPATTGKHRDAIEKTLSALGSGKLRVAQLSNASHEKTAWLTRKWHVNQWAKKAVLLGFRLENMKSMDGAPQGTSWWDKVPMKNEGWTDEDWQAAGYRAVPGSLVRRSAYIAPGVVLMPSFVNLGAYVGKGTMIDAWATVGSCAQIGADCHISGGAGIGGVLEPLQADPTIIEDNCFIGARSEVVEGVIVREGSVLGMGVFIGQSTKIVNRETGKITFGEVPPYSVVVAGSLPSQGERHSIDVNLYCAVIVKTVDEKTRSKTGINELLRDGLQRQTPRPILKVSSWRENITEGQYNCIGLLVV